MQLFPSFDFKQSLLNPISFTTISTVQQTVPSHLSPNSKKTVAYYGSNKTVSVRRLPWWCRWLMMSTNDNTYSITVILSPIWTSFADALRERLQVRRDWGSWLQLTLLHPPGKPDPGWWCCSDAPALYSGEIKACLPHLGSKWGSLFLFTLDRCRWAKR